jgi:hypothetical protein
LESLRELSDWLIDKELEPGRAKQCVGRIQEFYYDYLVPQITDVTMAITGKDWGDGGDSEDGFRKASTLGVRFRVLWPQEMSLAINPDNAAIMKDVEHVFQEQLQAPFFPNPLMQLSFFAPDSRVRPFAVSLREWCEANGVEYLRILATNPPVEPELLTASEVAQRLGLARQRVHQLVHQGLLKPAAERKINDRVIYRLFSSDAVQDLLRERIENPPTTAPRPWKPASSMLPKGHA